ncbi:MAG: tRNA (cytidine(34)-2'-O)-methyltransferase [Clostridiales bacterium]|jgi:tRNA (cytidine/uridine-2'-O-)-methyltransferase|nr:tRNA (cytidine(34)-2'-O)-methyltransferase [Clostridiales bacterium]
MNIVLLEPEIPLNTGNIGRTCVAAGCGLHLIKPLGFSLDEKYVKRSGLDYWHRLNLRVYENFQDFLRKNENAPIFMATTKAPRVYTEISYPKGSFIVFGKESAGIPEEILLNYQQTCMRIPMAYNERSLNLSNAAAIILYEALRQHNFETLSLTGKLTKSEWREDNNDFSKN